MIGILYKVLIVDDEILVRNSLISIMDWEKEGFEICGKAFNGRDAVTAITEKQPDIIILDIHMPVMDGVELSKYISKEQGHVKMIVLSSFDDFNYVKETMRNGAVDYLLKHQLTREVLLEQLKTCVDLIAKNRHEKVYSAGDKGTAGLSPIITEKYIRDLILGINNDGDFKECPKSLSDMFSQSGTILAVMQIQNFYIITENYYDKDKAVFINSIHDLCKQAVVEEKGAYICYIDNGRFAFLFSFKNCRSEAAMIETLNKYSSRIKEMLRRYMNVETCFERSSLFFNKKRITKYYNEICARMERGSIGGNIRRGVPVESPEAVHFTLSIDDEKNILSAIDEFDTEELNTIIEDIFGRFINKALNIQSLQLTVNELIYIIKKIILKKGLTTAAVYGTQEPFIEELSVCKRIEDMKAAVQKFYCILMEYLCSTNSRYSKYVQKAIDYVNENYQKNFSLDSVANEIGITPNYLSKKFKEETNMHFVEYVNSVKIKVAKKLIDGGRENIKSIYSRVGFNNYNYFFRVFKDLEGITPLNYSNKRKYI